MHLLSCWRKKVCIAQSKSAIDVLGGNLSEVYLALKSCSVFNILFLAQFGSGQQQHFDHRYHRRDPETPHTDCSPL